MTTTETTTLSKTAQIKLIERAYIELDSLNNIDWTPYRDRLYQMALDGEKKHRAWKPDGVKCGISATVAAKLFAVKWIADYMQPDAWMPQTKDFLSVRTDCFYAAALVLNYRDRITEAWQDLDITEIAKLDYANLME